MKKTTKEFTATGAIVLAKITSTRVPSLGIPPACYLMKIAVMLFDWIWCVCMVRW